MSTVVSIDKVSKSYHLGMIGGATLKEDFARWWAKLRGKADPLATIGSEQSPRRTREQFWALDEVSFDVKEGEVLGIIGRNGAGKSTLLKILSQVTVPTAGEIRIKGRIASLLEVGTGFHPDLTGRENIFLNGAILGMTKAEIRRNFDEIVTFSGIEEFLETPVKRYSSGMYVRLAFAVAAHLEPEILIVDEVLAVGDAEFQKKCLGKMRDVSRSGRTVLFVSHNMAAVSALCGSAVLLDGGKIAARGSVADVFSKYDALQQRSATTRDGDLTALPRSGTGVARFESIRLRALSRDGQEIPEFFTGGNLEIELEITAFREIALNHIAVIISDNSGTRLVDLNTAVSGTFIDLEAGASATVTVQATELLLKPGEYSIGLWLGRAGFHNADSVDEAASFIVKQDPKVKVHLDVNRSPYECRFTAAVAKRSGGELMHVNGNRAAAPKSTLL